VAEVDGRPVHASCVAAQAVARGVGLRDALDACIGFELLAGEAEARGYGERPEVLRTRRREAARALIRGEFDAGFPGPEEVPSRDLEAVWPRAKGRFDRPEHRFTVSVRAPVPEGEARGSDADLAALSLAEDVHEALAGHTNLEPERFWRLAGEIAGDRLLQRGEPFDFARDGAEEAFAEATFAIPEPGMISEPTRTTWGWDVILLTRVEPETHKSFEEALPELRELMFEPTRRRAFIAWAERLRDDARVRVEDDLHERLAELGGPLGAGP
jgi:hypothetical protein